MSVVAPARSECLSEDAILGLATGALADDAAAETHLASCATCSALLAAAVRDGGSRAWDALAGSTLGPYRIDGQIGAGGMGAVYRAWDPRLGRAIAIKVLHDRRDLATEARAAAAIDHRSIVAIFDVGEADGIHYVAMELVEGESLRSVLANGALGLARTRELAIALVDGLVAAHARGVVHRDLKPENLILTRDGLRILDFGLAKHVDATRLDETEPGTVQGTAGYMAPEQARGGTVDARADVFAVGAIAYELATGTRAFPGATAADRLSATLRDTPPLDALGGLAPIIARCLAKEPRDRFQTAADLAWALAAPAVAVPKATSRRAILAGGAAAIGTGVLGYLLGHRRSPERAAMKLRPLTHQAGRVFTARFLPDGNRVVYGAAWGVDPVAIHVVDLVANETTLLELPSADVLAVSRRGELLASVGHRFVDHQSARGKLVAASLAGGPPRPLADDVQEADFGRDETIAVVRAAERGFRLELPLGVTLVDEPGWITHPRVSPDGKRVVYLQHPDTDDDGGAIVLVDVATRTTRVLAGGWASVAGIAWERDGQALRFTASRDDLVSSLYRVTLAGDVTAIPTPTSGRLRFHDLAADGRGLVTIDAWRLRAMVGDHDRSMSEISAVADLTSDGTQVLIAEAGDLEVGNGTYLVPYAGGRPLRLGPALPIAVSPSGKLVAAIGREADHLVVYATDSGATPPIATPGVVYFGRWLDERSLLALFDRRVWRLGFDARPVPLADRGDTFRLDPARTRAAWVDGGALRVLDLAAGTTRVVAGDFGHTVVCGWLAEPDAIVVRSTTTPLILERVDPATGARSPHLQIQPPLMGLKAVDNLVLHADGKRFAYSYGQELSQLLVMPPL